MRKRTVAIASALAATTLAVTFGAFRVAGAADGDEDPILGISIFGNQLKIGEDGTGTLNLWAYAHRQNPAGRQMAMSFRGFEPGLELTGEHPECTEVLNGEFNDIVCRPEAPEPGTGGRFSYTFKRIAGQPIGSATSARPFIEAYVPNIVNSENIHHVAFINVSEPTT